MAEIIQAVKGMNDVLPADIGPWQFLESTIRNLVAAYGYQEMRVPVVEQTRLFKRAIGEFTDVVEKEMYTFEDQGGEQLTLRPEATAGIIRAAISNGMLRGARHKVWCIGPMFRHEKPQKGRYRQFHQLDIEAVGFAGPDVDAELIAMTARLWRTLGIERVKLQINSLGTSESRRAYRDLLVAHFRAHEARLDADSRRRLEGNPLRILDSKNPEMRDIIASAPVLTEHLDAESREHFDALCAALGSMGIEYIVNPRLVRGLDYYSRTVFEWTTDALGSQDAVCAGGRYDGLIGHLGGDATPAIGFAMGMERVVELLVQSGKAPPVAGPDAYVVVNGTRASAEAMKLAEQLRTDLPHRRIEVNLGGGNFKAQFRRADKSGAPLAIILGDDELGRGVVAVKPLRRESGQTDCPIAELPARLEAALGELGR
ncbi:MAG: histidine--tRNA ligase [Gammaproteobacteria bacterium]